MSNEWLKSDVFSHRLNTDSDGNAVTSDGRVFQTRAAETPKARSPSVTRRVGGMFSSSIEAEQSRHPELVSCGRGDVSKMMIDVFVTRLLLYDVDREACYAWKFAVFCNI